MVHSSFVLLQMKIHEIPAASCDHSITKFCMKLSLILRHVDIQDSLWEYSFVFSTTLQAQGIQRWKIKVIDNEQDAECT